MSSALPKFTVTFVEPQLLPRTVVIVEGDVVAAVNVDGLEPNP